VIEFDSIIGSGGLNLETSGLPSGYEQEVLICNKYLALGLGLGLVPEKMTVTAPSSSLHMSLSQPPRGLLVHGSAGVVKSRFVNHIITSSQFSRCTVIAIGSEILLKRYI